MTNENIKDTPQEIALQILKTTDMHLFLTGKAGTGKTTFLLNLDKHLSKRMVVLAPTGIAAINAHGMTIHSFFQLPFTPYIPGYEFKKDQNYKVGKNKLNLIKSLDLLIIDEISMVRADLLDAVDTELRRLRRINRPFGGVQLLMIGDLQQLPPVVNDVTWDVLRQYYDTPYFFSSKVLAESSFLTVELDKVYRQTDESFLKLLNKVREGRNDEATLSAINKRYIPNFRPTKEEGYIQLMTHNEQVTNINNQYLSELSGDTYNYEAVVSGKFPESSFPTEKNLILKRGAQIMFVKNDPNKRFFNGMIGQIIDIREDSLIVSPKDAPGTEFEVNREEWMNVRYSLDKETHEIIEILEGTFTQYPVKLAWAITIHKSQGLTFDKVIIDVSSSFSHGQTYVALSRCKTLDGIVLSNPILPSSIISDSVIQQFTKTSLERTVTDDVLCNLQKVYRLRLLNDLFSFEKERISLANIHRFFDVNLYQMYPQTVMLYQEALRCFDLNVMCVADKFHKQCENIVNAESESVQSDFLQERINKAAAYFIDQLVEVKNLISQTDFEIDNSDLRKRLDALQQETESNFTFHVELLDHVLQVGFEVLDYQHYKTNLMLNKENPVKKETSARKTPNVKMGISIPLEVKNTDLYIRLVNWRKQLSDQSGEKLFRVMPSSILIEIANKMPVIEDELLRIPKISKRLVENRGRDILLLIHEYLNDVGTTKPLDIDLGSKKTTKESKEKTYEHSLRLYLEGKNPQQIAEERGLTVGTIYSHLERYIESGKVSMNDLVTAEHADRIKNYLMENPRTPTTTLTEIREAIGEDVGFNEIRLVLKYLESQK